jgi:molybdopterin/thiamine biosynthesis adenylyltransferase
MCGKRHPSPDHHLMDTDSLLANFHLWLADNNFVPDETKANWVGNVIVEWRDIETGEWQTAEHTLCICLPEGFPYQAPIVFSKDDPPLAPSWHLSPGNPPSLCLWDSEREWKPEFTAHKLLSRIREWFYHYHRDTWPTDSQVPDLHLYLKNVGTVVIGEDWRPSPDAFAGQFKLWQSKFTNKPHLASCNGDESKPESRLADNLVLGSNPAGINGIWFRLPQPFIPSNKLDVLFHQIDGLLQKPSGWSIQKCIAAVSRKVAGKGFPIAIGYPDNLGELRWLFLWSRSPEQIKKNYKWSSAQMMRQTEVQSFRTAPSSKLALLRRSAFISKSLTTKCVTVFGAGALGSSVALLLAKAGVGKLRLIDSDSLMPGNVMRHACGLNYVGFYKTAAVKRMIHLHNPDCIVECFGETWSKTKLCDYITGCDLILDTTGNINFSRYLNKICVEFDQLFFIAAAYRRASVGRIIMHLDNAAPCLECYLGHREAWLDGEYPNIPINPDEAFIEDGCGAVTEEAVALDVEAIGNLSARQIVKLLNGSHSGNNMAIIVNEPLPDANNEIFCSPAVYFWTNSAYPSCSVCRI